jgi:ATP-dependent protease ClpP protease subunit
VSVPPYLRTEHAKLTPKALAGKPNSWFSIVSGLAAKDGEGTNAAEIFIYDEIGGWGILAADFVRELQALDADTITVRISSPGGSVFEALAIYASIKNIEAKVVCVIDGLCASAATVIAMAGDEITTAPGSMWMVHDAIGQVYGNAADMQQMCDLLGKTSANMAEIYAARAGGTAEEWRTAMQAETWYTAEEAVAAGLAADGLTTTTKATATAKAPVIAATTPVPTPVVIDFAELLRTAVREAVS